MIMEIVPLFIDKVPHYANLDQGDPLTLYTLAYGIDKRQYHQVEVEAVCHDIYFKKCDDFVRRG